MGAHVAYLVLWDIIGVACRSLGKLQISFLAKELWNRFTIEGDSPVSERKFTSWILFPSTQSPGSEWSNTFMNGRHCTHGRMAAGRLSSTMEMMVNHTRYRQYPSVSHRSVIAREILLSEMAKATKMAPICTLRAIW